MVDANPEVAEPQESPRHIDDVPQALAVMWGHLTTEHFMDEVAGWIDGLQKEILRLRGGTS